MSSISAVRRSAFRKKLCSASTRGFHLSGGYNELLDRRSPLHRCSTTLTGPPENTSLMQLNGVELVADSSANPRSRITTATGHTGQPAAC